MENLAQTNKSNHTIINYRTDLVKFIQWFESHYPGQFLNLSRAPVITAYQRFLTTGSNDTIPALIRGESRPARKIGPIRRFFHFIKSKFSSNKTRHQKLKLGLLNQYRCIPLSTNSTKRHLSCIKNFYEFLKQSNEDINELFQVNPVKSKLHHIKLKDADISHTVYLPPSDWDKIEDTIYRPEDRLLMHLLYFGGLRLEEAAKLKFENFKTHGQFLSFIRKGGKRHELHIQHREDLFKIIELHENFRKHHGPYLFLTKKGLPLSTRSLRDRIHKIIEKSGCVTRGLTPHSFRKACATNMYLSTKDLLKVRDYMGHADALVTQTYIDPSAI